MIKYETEFVFCYQQATDPTYLGSKYLNMILILQVEVSSSCLFT